MSSILVTGGAGLIGSHTVQEILKTEDSNVVVFDSMIRGKPEHLFVNGKLPNNLEIIQGDIQDNTMLSNLFSNYKFKKVFHFAAAWLRQCQEDPQKSIDVNIIGTFNLLKNCVDFNVEKLVAASSSSVYGDGSYFPTDEKHPFNNDLFYGASKIANEQHYISFKKKYGLNFNAMRFLNIYGPNQPKNAAYMDVIMNFFKKLENNERPVIRGDGSPTVDLVFAEDAAKACVLAMNKNISGEFFNVASGIETSLKELAYLIIEICGKKDLIMPEFNKDFDQGLVTRRIGSTEKARNLLGFNTRISPKEGLQLLYKWIKSS